MQNKSEQINELTSALVKVQAALEPAELDGENTFFKNSKYATLASVWTAARKLLSENGLTVTQHTEVLVVKDAMIPVLVTELTHVSGQWRRGVMPLYLKGQDSQSLGSAITYNRRFALAAMIGVIQKDDDGEAAMARNEQPRVELKEVKTNGNHLPDGIFDPSTQVPVGKNKGRILVEVPLHELESTVGWMTRDSRDAKEGKPLNQDWNHFIDQVKLYRQTNQQSLPEDVMF